MKAIANKYFVLGSVTIGTTAKNIATPIINIGINVGT